jgi:hypothetical protein
MGGREAREKDEGRNQVTTIELVPGNRGGK